MTPKQFIEKSIEGGYGKIDTAKLLDHRTVKIVRDGFICEMNLSEILLDSLAWQAVGKVEGWEMDDIEIGVGGNAVPKLQSIIDKQDEYIKFLEDNIPTITISTPGEKTIKHKITDGDEQGRTLREEIAKLKE